MTTREESRLPPEAHLAGLRSKLVSKLTGLTARQLGYWHRSQLLEATLRRVALGFRVSTVGSTTSGFGWRLSCQRKKFPLGGSG